MNSGGLRAPASSEAVSGTESTIPAPNHDVQVCSCCCRVISDQDWAQLPYVGLQDDGDSGWLELRNDVCGSTIARPQERPLRGFEVA